jgi:hypothetical protein
MIARIKVAIAALPLNLYVLIAYAVIAEKYDVRQAVQAETIILFTNPFAIGIVPFTRLLQLSKR